MVRDRTVLFSASELADCADDSECLALLLESAALRVPRSFLDQVRFMSIHNAEGALVMRSEGGAWTKARSFTDCELSLALYFVVAALIV